MFRIIVQLEGFDPDNTFAWTYDTPREMVRYLRKLGKRQLKRVPVARILSVAEVNL
jgi:hypothetical protein